MKRASCGGGAQQFAQEEEWAVDGIGRFFIFDAAHWPTARSPRAFQVASKKPPGKYIAAAVAAAAAKEGKPAARPRRPPPQPPIFGLSSVLPLVTRCPRRRQRQQQPSLPLVRSFGRFWSWRTSWEIPLLLQDLRSQIWRPLVKLPLHQDSSFLVVVVVVYKVPRKNQREKWLQCEEAEDPLRRLPRQVLRDCQSQWRESEKGLSGKGASISARDCSARKSSWRTANFVIVVVSEFNCRFWNVP